MLSSAQGRSVLTGHVLHAARGVAGRDPRPGWHAAARARRGQGQGHGHCSGRRQARPFVDPCMRPLRLGAMNGGTESAARYTRGHYNLQLYAHPAMTMQSKDRIEGQKVVLPAHHPSAPLAVCHHATRISADSWA